jgi:isopentenyl diphosphate isomerase/L-lactate dehydrogenase-like FMN-dependent dehydrogenase
VAELNQRWANGFNRRRALRAMAGFLAGSPLLRGQQDPFRDHSRIPSLNEMVTSFDFEPVAYSKVLRYNYDYMAYGTDSEFTLRRNREAFDWVELVSKRVLDASPVQTATEVLGTKMAFPIMVSPSASHGMLHPEAEAATYKGATAASKTPYIVSVVSTLPFDKIAAAGGGPLWYQMYPRQSLDDSRAALERAQAAGARAVVVTIDQQAAEHDRILHDRNINARVPATRRTASANPYRLPEYRLWYTWEYIDQIRPIIKVPLVAKGILTAEDAKLCLQHGVDCVYVSNHGGRSLDYAPATLEVLPEIVDAVGGKAPILFDSGVRRGSDVLKALALGASAICLGRVPRWGLGAYGAPGVQRILEIMQAEFVQAMIYTGRPTLASIDRSLVRTDFP